MLLLSQSADNRPLIALIGILKDFREMFARLAAVFVLFFSSLCVTFTVSSVLSNVNERQK